MFSSRPHRSLLLRIPCWGRSRRLLHFPLRPGLCLQGTCPRSLRTRPCLSRMPSNLLLTACPLRPLSLRTRARTMHLRPVLLHLPAIRLCRTMHLFRLLRVRTLLLRRFTSTFVIIAPTLFTPPGLPRLLTPLLSLIRRMLTSTIVRHVVHALLALAPRPFAALCHRPPLRVCTAPAVQRCSLRVPLGLPL